MNTLPNRFKNTMSFADEISRYLTAGEYEILETSAPGKDVIEKLENQHGLLISALINEVKKRSKKHQQMLLLSSFDTVRFSYDKLFPMVKGLFPIKEQNIVMATLVKSCVFLTSDRIRQIIWDQRYLSTAWKIANIYLISIGAETLSKDYSILGLSEETTFYVSMEYFTNTSIFDDYVVHEAAHIFHNNKRETLGLPFTRKKQWPLDIEYIKRETFAYSCEVYSCITSHAKRPSDKIKLFEKYSQEGIFPSKESVDKDEYLDILKEAVLARNGWKRILMRCGRVRRSYPNSPPVS